MARNESVLLPPKEAELEERLVKEPNWPEKDLAEAAPEVVKFLEEIKSVVREEEVIEEAVRTGVVRDWGLRLAAVTVPVTLRLAAARSPLTVRDSWMTVGEEMERGVVREEEEIAATLTVGAEMTPAAIMSDKAWMVLAVVNNPSEVREK